MKWKALFAAPAALGVLAGAAFAGEMADACTAALEADGRDPSGCVCLENEVMGDPALEEEFTALGEIADPAERYEAATDEAKAVMDKCTR